MIILVDPLYNPNFQSEITSATKLNAGITCAKFLGSPGTRTQFEEISGDKKLIARQLYLQAEVMKCVAENPNFKDYRMIVAEGVYKPAPSETPTPNSVNDYKQTGRAIVYQIINQQGEIDLEKSFEVAVYLKDFTKYQKLILDYDTFDPSGKVSCQIIIVMPEAVESFDLTYSKDLETTYNGQLQSKNELLELLF